MLDVKQLLLLYLATLFLAHQWARDSSATSQWEVCSDMIDLLEPGFITDVSIGKANLLFDEPSESTTPP